MVNDLPPIFFVKQNSRLNLQPVLATLNVGGQKKLEEEY